MIYKRQRQAGSKMKLVDNLSNKSDFEIIAISQPVIIEPAQCDTEEKIKSFKNSEQSIHFFAGELKLTEKVNKKTGEITQEYIRNDNSILNRSLIVVDIEDTGKSTDEVLEVIQNKLQSYKYIVYSTIRHKRENPRLRLILEPNRLIERSADYTATVNYLMKDILDINFDKLCLTWSQQQGAPVGVKGQEIISIKKMEGDQFPVLEGKEEVVRTQRPINMNKNNFTDEEFIDLFKEYLELDTSNLYTGNKDVDYNRALSVILSLARAVSEQDIIYEVAVECCEILALQDPNFNSGYIEGNIEKLNHAINSYIHDSGYFTNNPKSYTVWQKFRAIKDKNFIRKVIQGKPICNNEELFFLLENIGRTWRAENTQFNKNGEVVKIPTMPHYEIANILVEHLPVKLGGYDENSALLYYYNFDKGIYSNNEDYLKKCVEKLEYRQRLDKIDHITASIRTKVEFERLTRDPNNVAVGNGIFNLKSKRLEPFSPKYFITAKVDTNYNPLAIENYNKIKDNYFDFDKWFIDIANGDDEIVKLYWQLINEAINPNKTRRKIAIFLGNGKNGKSTFHTLLTNLIGINNISTLTPHEIQARFGLAGLEGKICNLADEIGTAYLDEVDKLKSIASGEVVSYERKNKDVRFYDFKTLLIFNSNTMPRIKEKTNALMDRLLIIPFNAKFEGKEDKSIKDEKLRDKVILEYALYKSLYLDFEHFIVPKAVTTALEDYKVENDSLYDYMLYYIENGYHDIIGVPAGVITEDYNSFCKDNGYNPRNKPVKLLCEYLNEYFKGVKTYEYKNKRYNSSEANGLKKIIFYVEKFEKTTTKSIVLQN